MAFQRDPETAPRLSQLIGGAGALWAFNLVLLLGVVLTLTVLDQRTVLGDSLVALLAWFLLLHGFLQWLYVLPGCLLLRGRRGWALGVLLGALVYTVGYTGLMLTLSTLVVWR